MQILHDRFKSPYLVSAFAIAALIIVYFPIISAPRVWAEEGVLYYPLISGKPFVEALFTGVNGNLQLPLNFFVWLSGFFQNVYFPYFTTYIGLILNCVIVLQLVSFAFDRKLPLLSTALAALAFVSLPTGTEVQLNGTNFQWLFAISAIFVCLSDVGADRRSTFAIKLFYLLICGLSGVPGCVVGILALLRFFNERSARTAILVILFVVCSSTQIFYIIFSSSSVRDISPTLETIVFPLVIQSVFVNTFSIYAAYVASYLALSYELFFWILSYCIVFLVMASPFAAVQQNETRRNTFYFAMLWLVSGIVQLIGALGDESERMHMISPVGGGRYTFTAQVCIIVILLLLSGTARLKRVIQILLCLCCLANIYFPYAFVRASVKFLPDWREQVAECQSYPCEVEIWPSGWSMTLREKN